MYVEEEDVSGTSVPCASVGQVTVVFCTSGASEGLKAFKLSVSAGTGRGGTSDTVADVSSGAMDASVHVTTRSLQVSKVELVHLCGTCPNHSFAKTCLIKWANCFQLLDYHCIVVFPED